MRNLIASVLFVFAVAGTAFAECSVSDKAALLAFDRAWSEASASGNQEALTAIYADDYAGLPAGQGKQGAIDGAMATAAATKANPNADKVTADHHRISCTANSALITHRNTIMRAEGAGGRPETLYSRSVHTLERRNGKWLVTSNAGSGLDDRDVLWYLEQDWNDAFWQKNKDWFEKTFTSDFTSVSSSSGQVMSRSRDIDDTMNNKATYDLVETSVGNIRFNGNTALVTGIFHLRGKDEKGAPVDYRLRYTDTWVKHDGRWMAWSSHGTTIPAAK